MKIVRTTDVIVTYLDGGFDISFGKKLIFDTDINGDEYQKLILYMKNSSVTSDDLDLILINEKKYVGMLIHYIKNKLEWGTNVVELVPNDICAHSRIDRADISKGIKRLVELNIIVQANTKDEYKDVSKYIYIVNHNYIFKGNIKNLIKEIKGND